jgi:hypothetical protein
MSELRNRVCRITCELDALMQELATVREERVCELMEQKLTMEVINGFKASVDAMRSLLWFYIDSASGSRSQEIDYVRQSLHLLEAMEVLRSRREAHLPLASAANGGSLIERIEAMVQERIPNHQPS